MNNSLVKEFFRAIREIRPKAFVMENVRMLSSETHRFYDSTIDHGIVTALGVKMREDELVLSDSDYNGYNLMNIIEADEVVNYKISDELFQLLYVPVSYTHLFGHYHENRNVGKRFAVLYEQIVRVV